MEKLRNDISAANGDMNKIAEVSKKLTGEISEAFKAHAASNEENQALISNCRSKYKIGSTIKATVSSVKCSMEKTEEAMAKAAESVFEAGRVVEAPKPESEAPINEVIETMTQLNDFADQVMQKFEMDKGTIENYNQTCEEFQNTGATDEDLQQAIDFGYEIIPNRAAQIPLEIQQSKTYSQVYFNQIKMSFPSAQKELQKKSAKVQEVTEKFTSLYQDVGKSFIDAANMVEYQAKLINPSEEISNIAINDNLFRYELEPLEFHHVALPDELMDLREQTPDYMNQPLPFGLAAVVRDFQALDINQLSVTQGQMLYLLEKPNREWILAQNILSKRFAFVPRSAIAPIGKGAALCTEDIILKEGNDEVHIKPGEFVAIIKDEREEIVVETLARARVRVPKEAFVILNA